MARWEITVKRNKVGSGGGTTSSVRVEASSEQMAAQIAIDKVRGSDPRRHENEYHIVKTKEL